MTKSFVATALGAILLTISAAAQSAAPPFPVTLAKDLAARATNYNEISLDKKMLGLAGRFMSSPQSDNADVKRILGNLDAIYVREYEFDKPGQYTAADLEQVRSQFQGSAWMPLVRSRSKNNDNDNDIYMKMVNGKIEGMFVLTAEPKELSFVYIDGTLDPAELSKLGGNFGIPKGLAGGTAPDKTK